MKHKLLSILLCLAMALSLLPTAALADETTGAGSIKVGNASYESFSDAVNAATPDESGVITYKISGKVDVTDTSWVQVAKADLTDFSKVEFIGITDDAEICITQGVAILADQSYDIDVSFEALKLTKLNPQWADDFGHSTNYFTCWLRNKDAAENTVTYTNCTFPNGVCNNQYGKTVFDRCQFTNSANYNYNLWNYGGNTEVEHSAFIGVRGIKTYNEGTLTDAPTVKIKQTTFSGLTEKAAIVVSKATDITLTNVTATDCTMGLLQKDIEGSTDGQKVTIEANGTDISGEFNITDQKDAEAAKNEFNISGGKFTSEVKQDYCKDGFEVKAGADGTYTVEKSNNVAEVGGKEFTSLAEAFAALNETNHTLTLIDNSAWDADTPVYWEAGTQSDYAATLTEALTAAYMKNEDEIIIVCRPDATIAKSNPHINVTGDITVYANGADFGGNDLSIGTYAVPDNSTTSINIYDAKNLVVWGQPAGGRADIWNVNFTDCVNDGWNFLMYRGAETGTAKINATLTGCKATGFDDSIIHTTADGRITIKNCEFTNNCAPVNIAHKQTGAMTVTVENSTFTNCGEADTTKDLYHYAAPVRIVNNNAAGTVATEVTNCTFTGTVGNNGDILIGDGRDGKASNDVSLTVSGTAANVQAQKPGYYNGESTDVTKMMAKQVAENERLETSVNELLPNAAKIGNTEYATLKEALKSLSNTPEENVTIELLADQNVAGFTVDLSTSAIKTLTIQGNGKKLDSLVNGVDIDGKDGKDGKPRCPVINAELPADATFSVDGIVAPNSLLFDTGSEASLVVMNSTFNESQTGYPAAKNITYQGNTFEFKGDASKYYTNNAYPIWYKTETTTRNIAFLNNKVTGPRGFHIETRSKDTDKHVNIKANGNTFNLSDSSDYKNKTIALQLVANLNGEIEFKDNQVNAYMGVCFFKGIVAQNDSKLTIKNNYTSGKLYGSSEWNTDGSTTEEKIAAAENFAREIVEGRKSANNGSAITEGHTHNYVNDKCTICGQTAPSYSGGSSSDPTYSVSTPSKTENGTVTVSPKRASKGDTVTVTVKPDSGYVLETLTVTDKNGNELTLKDKGNGKYTFTMPRSRVTIEATFAEIEEEPDLFFVDVPTSAYYYDAVYWVAENGVTYGTSATTFSPDVIVSRAQMVTFLWRAHGSPAPRSSVNPFTDITSDMYYYDAVLWAVENGVTNGISATTFSPDATVTRAQAVTFQWRAAGSPAVSGSSFADVADSAYYAGAVSWAVANGVTNGTGGSNFSPDVGVSRAQAVTFLWRQLAA